MNVVAESGDGSSGQVDYAAVFAAASTAYLVISPELVVLAANDAYLALTRTARESIVGRRLSEAFPFDPKGDLETRRRVEGSLHEVLRTRARHDLKRQRCDLPDGEGGFVERHWDVSNTPVLRGGRVEFVVQVLEDVSAQVLEAMAAEARFDATFEQHAVGIALVSPDGRFLRVNGHLCNLLGRGARDLGALRVQDVTHPEDLAASRRQAELLIDGAVPYYTIEKRYLRADGTPLWVSVTRSMVRSASGRPEHFVIVVEDVSARKAAEASLREREARLRSILDTVPDGMVVIDQRGMIESFSKTAEQMFGYEAEEVIGRNIALMMPPGDRERHDGYIRGYLETGVPRIIGHGRAVTAQRKDGSRFELHLSVGEILLGDRRMFVGFVRDLTERQRDEARVRELQTELAHVSRLTALGEMASALAHEINQPLTAVTNFLRGSRRILDQGAEGRLGLLGEAIDQAADQALRAGQIIRRLRDFVSRGETQHRDEDLRGLVEEACALALVGSAERGVRTSFTFDPAAATVRADRIQIQQVVVNLVRNALEAMGDVERRALHVSTAALPDGMVEVTVRDTGSGLAPEVAGRLFQPFVTTKPTGMGVGLSICRTIVEAHDGTIGAQRSEGGGTTFWFTLPSGRPHGP